jgi:hypothetical protein
VVPGKRPVRLALPEDPRARSNEVVVKHPLVKRALPPPPVDRLQPLPALLHALKSVALDLGRGDQVVFEGRSANAAIPLLLLALACHSVKVFKVLGQ